MLEYYRHLCFNKINSKLRYIVTVLAIFGFYFQGLAQNIELKGKVVDDQNRPIQYATISFPDFERVIYSNADGVFAIALNNKQGANTVKVRISFVGKKVIETTVSTQSMLVPTFTMVDLALILKDVEINQQRKIAGSNSSIVFDRQAIEQAQAFSLTEILNNLPGKKLVAPDLHRPQNLTLRSQVSGIQAMNNALGIAIVVDDIQLSNNANMQNRSVGRWGLGSTISNPTYGSFDTPFGGLDLRDLPADNIESIEVITGVAPAKYGDMTDGAVIINRQAGRTPYQFNTRINGGSTNYALSKGYKLKDKWGALNVGLNYLQSNEDPSDKTKVYDRVSTNLIWTAYPGKTVKNTFSLDYSTKLDDVKLDPDDDLEIVTFSKNRNFRLSNRTAISFQNSIIKSLNMSLSYSGGYQETYNQRYLNGAPKGISDKETTNEIYEGYYIPGNYLSFEHIIGRPNNMNGNISLSNEIFTGKLRHNLSVGGSLYFSENVGQGIIVDPSRPRWANTAYQNDRPYSFEALPNILNYGLYVQDNTKFNVFNKELSVNAGLRYDVQNGVGSLQPRINMAYKLKPDMDFTLAYGRSTKSPTLSHRYPAPNYIDLVLLNQYTGNIKESIFLVYTDKFVADNSYLKPSESQQVELGLRFKTKMFSNSLIGYFKDNKNGFSSNSIYRTYELPVYKYTYVQNDRPIITPTGETSKRYVSVSNVGNDLISKSYGLEWGLRSPVFSAIETSISMNTSFSYSKFRNLNERMVPTSQQNIDAGRPAWFGIYPAHQYKAWDLMSKISTTTHIPQLGFVVNLLADVYWQEVTQTLANSYLPIAYLDKEGRRFDIKNFDPNDPQYGYLALTSAANSRTDLPFAYANLSLRISKEIKEKIRLSVNAYNFLNLRYRYFNPNTNTVMTYSYPTSVGAEISIKF